MRSIVLYFHVHQPYRVKNFDVFSIGQDNDYFDEKSSDSGNKEIVRKVAKKCYLPTNELLLKLLEKHPEFRVSFSLSGVLLEQLEKYQPRVIDSFRELVKTGKVELVSDTYHHSLAFVYSKDEFVRQVKMHEDKMKQMFGYSPTCFRNTELIYNNEVAKVAEDLGYNTILAEGVDRYMDWRSPNYVYKPVGAKKIRLLLKNYTLSDDVAFRFSDKNWAEWPLTAEKFVSWLNQANGDVVNLFMDYETFGEHQWEETGIFEFLEKLPGEVLRSGSNSFLTVSQAAWNYPVVDSVNMPELTSWADMERDLSAWLENPMQQSASRAVYEIEDVVIGSGDEKLIDDWRKLTTSDHYYYMCTKWFSDGDVHKYFSPNSSPQEAYTNFMNVLHDLRQRVYTE